MLIVENLLFQEKLSFQEKTWRFPILVLFRFWLPSRKCQRGTKRGGSDGKNFPRNHHSLGPCTGGAAGVSGGWNPSEES
jgi:hypothetical protein